MEGEVSRALMALSWSRLSLSPCPFFTALTYLSAPTWPLLLPATPGRRENGTNGPTAHAQPGGDRHPGQPFAVQPQDVGPQPGRLGPRPPFPRSHLDLLGLPRGLEVLDFVRQGRAHRPR